MMNQRDELINILEHSRSQMLTLLDEIDKNRKIYPLWTIREMLAHLSGWDDAVIAFIKSIMAGSVPATPAARGIDVYNAETVAARAGLDYDHIYRDFIETRKILMTLLKEVPEEKITAQYILPWGEPGSLVDIIHIFGPHEEEHAEDIAKLISQSQNA
jgi:hypothetical protein